MVERPLRRIAAIAAMAALVAGPASAAVSHVAGPPAAIHLDRACYVRLGPAPPRMTLTGSGFAPDDQVTVTDATGTLHATIDADSAGAVRATFAGPGKQLTQPGELRDTIIATDQTATGTEIVGSTVAYLSALGAAHGTTPSAQGLKALTEPTSWVFSGWPVGRPIYVHYLLKGKAVARQRFEQTTSPCGILRARAPLYPKTPHASSYRTQIDAQARYSPHTTPRFLGLKVGLELEF